MGDPRQLPSVPGRHAAAAAGRHVSPDVLLSEIAQLLLSEGSADRVFEAVADALAQLVPHDTLSLYQADNPLRVLRPVLVRDAFVEQILAMGPIPYGAGITGRTAQDAVREPGERRAPRPAGRADPRHSRRARVVHRRLAGGARGAGRRAVPDPAGRRPPLLRGGVPAGAVVRRHGRARHRQRPHPGAPGGRGGHRPPDGAVQPPLLPRAPVERAPEGEHAARQRRADRARHRRLRPRERRLRPHRRRPDPPGRVARWRARWPATRTPPAGWAARSSR